MSFHMEPEILDGIDVCVCVCDVCVRFSLFGMQVSIKTGEGLVIWWLVVVVFSFSYIKQRCDPAPKESPLDQIPEPVLQCMSCRQL